MRIGSLELARALDWVYRYSSEALSERHLPCIPNWQACFTFQDPHMLVARGPEAWTHAATQGAKSNQTAQNQNVGKVVENYGLSEVIVTIRALSLGHRLIETPDMLLLLRTC